MIDLIIFNFDFCHIIKYFIDGNSPLNWTTASAVDGFSYEGNRCINDWRDQLWVIQARKYNNSKKEMNGQTDHDEYKQVKYVVLICLFQHFTIGCNKENKGYDWQTTEEKMKCGANDF